jgi:hypothetical protein
MTRYGWVVLALMIVGSCKPDTECTTVADTRCNANVAEICQSDNTWSAFEDCTALSASNNMELVCCYQPGDEAAGIPAGHTCLPPAQCEY